MTMHQRDHQRTERALEALESLKRASAPSYFYARLRARMEKQVETAPPAWYLRPAFAFCLLALVLSLNALLVLRNPSQAESQSSDPLSSSFTEDYNLQDVVSFYEQINER